MGYSRFAFGISPAAIGWADAFRQATRQVARRPCRAITLATILGMAIGLTTSMFGIADAVILRPVPFRDSNALARVGMRSERGGIGSVSGNIFVAWRDGRAFANVQAATSRSRLVTSDYGEASYMVADVTPGMSELLGGLAPVEGRLFGPQDTVGVAEGMSQ